MNKKYLIAIAVIVLLIVGYTLLKTSPTNTSVNSSSTTVTSEKSLVNFNDFSKGEIGFGNLSTYTDTKKQNTISFKLLTDPAHQARNETLEVYLNQTKIGEVVGQGVLVAGFSPTGKYFAFRTRSVLGCAGNCLGYEIRIVDITAKKLITAKLPPDTANTKQYNNSTHFVESLKWNTSDHLEVTSYFTAVDTDSKPYRISLANIWDYNPLTNQYTAK